MSSGSQRLELLNKKVINVILTSEEQCSESKHSDPGAHYDQNKDNERATWQHAIH